MNTVLLCILSLAIAIPFAESRAYCTYHLYNAGDSLTTVACSDGANGIMTNFGYSNISPMFPYVTAYSGASWNSPQCGRCVRLTSGGRTVHLTVIDYCGPPPAGSDAHFDIAPPAFRELFGDAGVNAGVQYADWTFVDTYSCQGNKGNSGGNPPPPPPPVWNPPPPTWNPPPPASGSSSIRCGRDWSDANGKCGTPCVDNDGPCGGEKCFRDLNTAPCGRATEDDVTSFSSEENVVIEESFNNDNFDDTFAAVTDTAEEEFVDNYVDMAVADASFEIDSNFDAAVVGEDASSVNTQQQPQQVATGMQGWMVAILVMFSITTVLLLAVIILGVFVMRKH